MRIEFEFSVGVANVFLVWGDVRNGPVPLINESTAHMA